MRLTSTHAQYWASRQPPPAWFARLMPTRCALPRPTIDDVVNAHADTPLNRPDNARNTLALVRMMRRRMSTRDALAYLAADAATKQHRVNARRWLRRIDKGRSPAELSLTAIKDALAAIRVAAELKFPRRNP